MYIELDRRPEGVLTEETVIDGSLILASSKTITPDFKFLTVNPFLSRGILEIEFTGIIRINNVFRSDESKPMILTTCFYLRRLCSAKRPVLMQQSNHYHIKQAFSSRVTH